MKLLFMTWSDIYQGKLPLFIIALQYIFYQCMESIFSSNAVTGPIHLSSPRGPRNSRTGAERNSNEDGGHARER